MRRVLKRWLQHQIFRRISIEEQFRKDDQVRARRLGFGVGSRSLLGISRKVSDNGV